MTIFFAGMAAGFLATVVALILLAEFACKMDGDE